MPATRPMPQHGEGAGHGVSLEVLTRDYLAWASAGRYAGETVRVRRCYLRHFESWFHRNGIKDLSRIDADGLEAYRTSVCGLENRDGTRIGTGAVTQRLLALRGFLRWCTARGIGVPAWDDALTLPKREQRLPTRVLTAAQVERLMAQPDLDTALGLRDRAMLELLYATGLRRAEAARLTTADLDQARCTVWVRRAKNARDRVVPLGRRALGWIRRYLAAGRPALLRSADPPWLFLTWRGNPWRPKHLSERVASYLRRAGLAGRGSCHVLRHTMATLMFERGADIRALQAMLGHARLSTTEIYTRVGIAHLCEVHARTHPGDLVSGVEWTRDGF